MKNNKPTVDATPAGVTSLKKQMLPWMAGLLVLLLAGLGLIAQLLLVAAPKDSQLRQAQNLATQEAALVDFTLKQYQARATTLASNAQVQAALADPAQAQVLATQLSNLLAPAKVVLVSDQDKTTAASLSFLERDSLAQVSAQQPVVQLTAGKDSQLLTVFRSQQGNGSILVSQPLADLWQKLAQTLPSGAAISARQGALNLLQAGDASASIQGSASTASGVALTVSLPLHANLMQQPLFLLIVVALLILAALLMWLLGSRLQSLLQKDADWLQDRARRLTQGGGASAGGLRLDALLPLDAAFAGLAKATPKEVSAKAGKKVERPNAFTDILVDDGMAMLAGEDKKQATAGAPSPASMAVALPEEIFRAYDIRGEVGKTLTKEYVELIGRAIGSEAQEVGQQTVIVARDGRLSGPELSQALINGLRASGRDVIDIGDVPTPVLYYATKVMDTQTGVCLTGSHNPENYNGLKIVINGDALYGDRIQALRQRIAQGKLASGMGRLDTRDISERYLGDILQDIVLAKQMKVVIDCGNGIAGKLAPQLFRDLGCDVTELFCEVDGHFPNHHPDPGKEENLQDLIRVVAANQADIGLAFDGDGDRVGVVTGKGEIIWADRLMMLFAKDLLSRSPGVDIIFDVKCSRALPALIRRQGGRPLMWKTGHSLIKAKLKETGAPLAGEMSGHIFFADRWFGVDDGLYAAARLLEILSLAAEDSDGVFAQLQTGLVTPELQIKTTEADKFRLVKQLCDKADQFPGGSPTTLDGLRMDYPDGWGLVRASNTTPLLIARFEGKDEAALERIKAQFAKQLAAIDASLELPF